MCMYICFSPATAGSEEYGRWILGYLPFESDRRVGGSASKSRVHQRSPALRRIASPGGRHRCDDDGVGVVVANTFWTTISLIGSLRGTDVRIVVETCLPSESDSYLTPDGERLSYSLTSLEGMKDMLSSLRDNSRDSILRLLVLDFNFVTVGCALLCDGERNREDTAVIARGNRIGIYFLWSPKGAVIGPGLAGFS